MLKKRKNIFTSIVTYVAMSLLLLSTSWKAVALGEVEANQPLILLGIGDSLTHGTMNATNNYVNTHNAYLQKLKDSLQQTTSVVFSQPYFMIDGDRLFPSITPTNLGVDGADVFSAVGVEYYKRVGAAQSFVTTDYLCERKLPAFFNDNYDRVLYPINLHAQQVVSQMRAANWWFEDLAADTNSEQTAVVLWMGSNDSSLASLGLGGENPTFVPLPFDQIAAELSPLARAILALGRSQGLLSFAPYTAGAIDRNLTDAADFNIQYDRLVQQLLNGVTVNGLDANIFLATLPYYSSVGYLMDSTDLEFYLQKVAPDYVVPASFKLSDPTVTAPVNGDRVPLFTFAMMYVLLETGYSVDYVNGILLSDGLVLSESEQATIVSRIDGFNQEIKDAAITFGENIHLVDVGQKLNDTLTGVTPITIAGREFNRHWSRGNAFSLDGVHPGYVGHALIANEFIDAFNSVYGLNAPLQDLEQIAVSDPYVDRDGDGWVKGPDYAVSGVTELLFFFTDADDTNPTVQVDLPVDIWDRISDVLISMALTNTKLRALAIERDLVSE